MPELRVRRDDFAICDLVVGEGPRENDLAPGEAQLRVDRFALTTDTVATRSSRRTARCSPAASTRASRTS